VSNAVLPVLPGLAWDNTTAPHFATKIQTSVGMSEVRAAFSPYPVRHYMLVHNFLRQYTPAGGSPFTEMNTLYGFYCSRQGSFDSFLYDDPADDTVTLQQFGTGDGATVAFQLNRTRGGFNEPVYNTHSTPLIYINGVLKSTPADYTINSSGLVTFTAAPGNGLPVQWTGTYYWRCRFDDDAIDFTEFANLFWSLKKLAFRTVLNA
jgi:uncharacterized protein (TIGR02217 family)